MKYLRKFKHFENIDTDITDEPDIKLAKEYTNNLEKALKDFPALKVEIDKAFMENDKGKANEGEDESSDNEMLNKKIEEIKKNYASKNPDFPNNPLLEEYTKMMNLQLRIKHVEQELLKYNDQLYQNGEDLKQLASTKGDVSVKTKTINDIKSKQKIKTQEIEQLKKDLLTANMEQKKKMAEIGKEMQDSSKKISDDIKK
jgi:hypothetical protein